MLNFDHISVPLTATSPEDDRPTYENELLSVSRLKKFEQCPKAFELTYLRRLASEDKEAFQFGNLIHGTLEEVFAGIVADGLSGPFPKERMLDVYARRFAESALRTHEVFEEGREILSDFAARNGMVEASDVIGIEREFTVPVGRWKFRGYIDRIDGSERGVVKIRDYKTNRMLFSQEECDRDLQATVYLHAGRVLFPHAEKIVFVFDMLRHGVEIETERTPEQLDASLAFVQSLAEQTESATEFPATLNPFCAWCDQSKYCDEYQAALALTPEKLAESLAVTPESVEAIAVERERVANLARLLDQRKRELEKLIKARIAEVGSFHAAGMRYSMIKMRRDRTYDDRVVEVLADKGFGTVEELRKKLVTVDAKRVDDLLKKKSKDLRRADAKMLRAEVEALAKVGYTSRFDARKEKPPQESEG